jgi:hypothetical protein
MAEIVIGENSTLEQMGGALMHCTTSGCSDILVRCEREAIEWAQQYLSYLPSRADGEIPKANAKAPAKPPEITFAVHRCCTARLRQLRIFALSPLKAAQPLPHYQNCELPHTV